MKMFSSASKIYTNQESSGSQLERMVKHLCEKSKSQTVNQFCSSVWMLKRGEKDFFRENFYFYV